MSDFDAGGASASADSSSAPIDAGNDAVSLPNPVNTEPPEPKAKPAVTEPAKKPETARDALLRAAKAVEKGDKADKADTKALPDTNGKMKDDATAAKAVDKTADKSAEKVADKATADKDAAKPDATAAKPVADTTAKAAEPAADKPKTPHTDAPSRFHSEAKATWETTPDAVKEATHRAIRELEQGHQRYKADAEAFEPLRQYHEIATKQGTSVKGLLDGYVQAEKMIRDDVVTGIDTILRNIDPKMSLRGLAEHVLGQAPDKAAGQQEGVIHSLRQKINDLESQIGGVTDKIGRQEMSVIERQVSDFYDANPRAALPEVENDMKFFLESKRANTLEEAFKLADRLHAAPVQASLPVEHPIAVASDAKVTDPDTQTVKGSKSIAGAPTAGSNPARKGKPSTSIRDSLARAMSQTG